MERVDKVAVLHNEVEAQLVGKVLSDQQIPHVIRSYHDTATMGFFRGLEVGGMLRPRWTFMSE